jgi:hypothetical protein
MRARLILLAANVAVLAALFGKFSARSWSDGDGW